MIARGVALVVALAACSSGRTTQLVIDVSYDEAWGLDAIAVTTRDRTATTAPTRELVVIVPDEWADEAMAVELYGMREGQRIAHGRVAMVPVLGLQARGAAALEPMICGAWCTIGATRCQANAIVTCGPGDDPCRAWSEPVACPSGTTCSLGACTAACVDECAMGETTCDGPGGFRTCGQADLDPCLDWSAPTACAAGDVCVGGACAATCQSVCDAGDVICSGTGTITCGDLDFDGCTEWGPPVACPQGQFCSGGACAGTCEDECTGPACAGQSYAQCGQYDFDPCLDLSPGATCVVPDDPCTLGQCTPAGCTYAPVVCAQPPPSVCADDETLRTFDAAGTCAAGTCSYPFNDERCPAGCENGACRGFCDEPTCFGLGCCGDRCCEVVPSNASDYGQLEPTGLVLTSPALEFSTTTHCTAGSPLGDCVAVPSGPPGGTCVCRSDELTVTGRLDVYGSRALALLVYRKLSLTDVVVDAGTGEGRPNVVSGSRGGSYGTDGGNGGTAWGVPELVPLKGGMRGQGASPAGGGLGGGAIQLTAGRSIIVQGGLGAGGNGGLGGCYREHGRGGGSGGGILVEAPSVTVYGVLAANGGGGGGGANNISSGCAGGGQRALLSRVTEARGGLGAEWTCNPGGQGWGGDGGTGSLNGRNGGNGRNGSTISCQPSNITMKDGGGGGGAGRIRVNTFGEPCNCAGGSSPAATFGTLVVH